MIAADHLGDVADHLIGHFVDQARRSGASWTEIGAQHGGDQAGGAEAVRAQGARRAADLDPARASPVHPARRNVVVRAQNEARAAGNAEIGPGHLVLGLLAEPEGLAARALAARTHPGRRAAAATAALPPPADDVPALIPFDARAKKALELTFREALRLGHNYVGTEHILLALLELEGGDGLLSGLGVDKAGRRGGGRRLDSGRAPGFRGGPSNSRFTAPADSIVGQMRAGDDLQPGPGIPAASVRACGSTGVAASSAPATTSVGAVIAGSRSRWSQTASAAQQPMYPSLLVPATMARASATVSGCAPPSRG